MPVSLPGVVGDHVVADGVAGFGGGTFVCGDTISGDETVSGKVVCVDDSVDL